MEFAHAAAEKWSGPTTSSISRKRHRFSAEVFAHAVWPYHQFPLSLRHIEGMLRAQGIQGFIGDHLPVGCQVRP